MNPRNKLTFETINNRTITTPYNHMWSRRGYVQVLYDTTRAFYDAALSELSAINATFAAAEEQAADAAAAVRLRSAVTPSRVFACAPAIDTRSIDVVALRQREDVMLGASPRASRCRRSMSAPGRTSFRCLPPCPMAFSGVRGACPPAFMRASTSAWGRTTIL